MHSLGGLDKAKLLESFSNLAKCGINEADVNNDMT